MARQLLTVGHGTLAADNFTSLLVEAGVETVVDVRAFPGSRRHPHFGCVQMTRWLRAVDVAYRWEPRLGGRRKGVDESPHTALRVKAFRAYADHMETEDFRAGLTAALDDAEDMTTAVMCSESLWWRCHRRIS